MIVSFLFVSSAIAALDITLLDKDFCRDKGAPVTETHTFTGKEGLATITVYNGTLDDSETAKMVSSSEILLNGTNIFGTSDFNQNVAQLTKQINLVEDDNTISVQLMGKPGGKIRVEIVQEVEGPFSSPSDPDKIINDEGAVYPINEIIINLTDEASNEDAQEISNSIGGTIVGFVPSIKLLQVKVSATSKEDLQELADELSNNNNSLIEGVFYNYSPALLDIEDHDLTRNEIGDRIDAYRKIKLIEAYNYLLEKNHPFKEIKFGIIDNGLEKSHTELSNLDWGDTPDIQPGSHGTSVTGIIGANNLKGEMNGIIAGIPNPNSDYGSKIEYTIEFRDSSQLNSAHNIHSMIDELALKKVQVINMSFQWVKRSWIGRVLYGGVKDGQFYDFSTAFYEAAYRHYSIVFVAGAGNDGIDSSNVVPACVETENFITVGATNLEDERAEWVFPELGGSNFGDVVDIAAPGEHVYAPTLNNDYEYFEKTSAATPMVTGVVGLLLALDIPDKKLEPADIKQILRTTGYDISTTDKPIGGKRLDAYEAVKHVVDHFVDEPIVVSFEFSGHITESYEESEHGIKVGDSFSGKVTYDIGKREDEDSDTTIGSYPCPYEICGGGVLHYCEDETPLVLNNKIEVTVHGEWGDYSFSTCSEAFIRDQNSDLFMIGNSWEKEHSWGQSLNDLRIYFSGPATAIENDNLPKELNLSDWESGYLAMSLIKIEKVCVDEDTSGDCIDYQWVDYIDFQLGGQIDQLDMIE